MADQTFRYGKLRMGLYLVFALAMAGWGVSRTLRTTGEDQRMAALLALLGAAAVVVIGRLVLDRRPAVGVGPEGLMISRLGGIVPWDEIAGAWLKWTKRRMLLVIPVNSPELALEIPKSAGYWRRGGVGRTLMRWLSALSDNHEVVVNLNGLAGGKPERVIEAIRAVRPELVRDTVTVEGAKEAEG